MALLAIEALLVYGVGLTITLPHSQADSVARTLSVHLQREWPQVQGPLLKSVEPILRQEVKGLVKQLTINIGGIRIALPPDVRNQVASQVDTALQASLADYFRHRFNPAQVMNPRLIRELLAQPVKLHLWVDVWRIPVPVTVQLQA